MTRTLRLILAAVVTLCATACASYKDIKVTGCELTAIVPRGLTSFDATMDISVSNPASEITLSEMNALVKLRQEPCLHLTAEDVTIAPRSENVYTVIFHGDLDGEFNPFSLLPLLRQKDFSEVTIDLGFRGTLRSGLGKYFEYKDIPVTDLLPQQ